jgi:hypothetical protein
MTRLRYAAIVLATLAICTPGVAATHSTFDVVRPMVQQHTETHRGGFVHAYRVPYMPSRQQRMDDPFASLLLG